MRVARGQRHASNASTGRAESRREPHALIPPPPALAQVGLLVAAAAGALLYREHTRARLPLRRSTKGACPSDGAASRAVNRRLTTPPPLPSSLPYAEQAKDDFLATAASVRDSTREVAGAARDDAAALGQKLRGAVGPGDDTRKRA